MLQAQVEDQKLAVSYADIRQPLMGRPRAHLLPDHWQAATIPADLPTRKDGSFAHHLPAKSLSGVPLSHPNRQAPLESKMALPLPVEMTLRLYEWYLTLP